jgi:enoyl-CoA hydratase/carnithine racemase
VRFENGLEPVAQHETLCFTTRDHKEVIDAFLEKREPKFTGH